MRAMQAMASVRLVGLLLLWAAILPVAAEAARKSQRAVLAEEAPVVEVPEKPVVQTPDKPEAPVVEVPEKPVVQTPDKPEEPVGEVPEKPVVQTPDKPEEPVVEVSEKPVVQMPDKPEEPVVEVPEEPVVQKPDKPEVVVGPIQGVPENSPVGKILSLLGELTSQLADDAAADSQQFQQYEAWYLKEVENSNKTIENTQQTKDSLDTELQQQEALRQEKSLAIEEDGTKLTTLESDLDLAVRTRAAESQNFTASETEVVQAIQTLTHALAVMAAKSGEEAPVEKEASLMDVARKVRTVLLQGQDFSLTLAQRETLDGFLRLAVRRSHRADSSAGLRGANSEALVPDFLQTSALTDEPPGTYESRGGGVVTALQSVLDKAKVRLNDLRTEEANQSTTFKKYETELKEQIKTVKSQLDTAKQQMAESQERSGKAQADLLASEQMLKVTVDGVAQLQADFAAKNTSFWERTRKREDERLAVQEASEIIQSEEMKKILKEHYHTSAPAPAPAPAFLQLREASRRKFRHALHRAKSSSAALLTLRTQTQAMRSANRDDPFAKVTDLIREMIARLSEEYSKELTKAQWCESEMSKSAKSQLDINKAMEKLKARIEEIDIDLEQLDADMRRIQQDINDTSEATSEATILRSSEQTESESALVRYKDAQRILTSAVSVLRKVYGQQESSAGSEGGDTSDGYKASGVGAGVVGLLEIAIEDFAQLEQETETAESVAQKDYKELMDSTEIKTAVLNKDLEYKNAQKVKLEGDRMRDANDLDTATKELSALDTYMEELKVQCPKAETYEERKARREEDIRQLQETLTVLSGSADHGED